MPALTPRIPDTAASREVPSFTVKVGGKPLARTYQVLSVRVQSELNRIPTAHLVLRDGDAATGTFAISEEELFVPGRAIAITAGYTGKETAIFSGLIVKHGIQGRSSGTTLLHITCKDAFVRTTLAPTHHYYQQKKDSEVAEEIVRRYPSLSIDAEATRVVHAELLQYDATDWDFLVMRAEANGQVCLVENGKLILGKPRPKQAPVARLQFGATLLDFDAELDVRDQVATVTATAWDYAEGAPVSVDAAEPTSQNEQGNWDGKKLGSALQTKLTLRHTGHLPTDELQAWADGTLLKHRLGKIRGRVQFYGNAKVKPGTVVSLAGLGKRFNGAVYVTGVSHRLEQGQWLTDAQFGLDPRWFGTEAGARPAATGKLLPALQGLQIGVVTALEGDPDGEERIAVRLPLVAPGGDGARARVVNVDAGKGRGMYFRPEVGDEVVVGFLQDDPREAVVLGSLYSSRNPVPAAFKTEDANNRKGFVSRSNLQVVFDDEKKILTLSTPGGNLLKLDDDAKSITIQDQHGNKITLSDAGIALESAKALTLKATTDAKLDGKNVELTAQAQFKAAGSAGAELSSSANAVLKGSMVMIN